MHALAAAATVAGAALLPPPPPHTLPAPDALPPLQSMCMDGDCRYSQPVGKARQEGCAPRAARVSSSSWPIASY